MKLGHFFWGYTRRHIAWVVLALAIVPIHGLAFVGSISLIEPIFGEVLLADSTSSMLLPGGGSEAAEDDTEGEQGLLSKLNLKRLSTEAYKGLKSRLGIDASNVYWFTPLLFLTLWMFAGLARFASSYMFRMIGLSVTNDIRNDIHARLLKQSSRFHSVHTSGELVSRVVNDVNQLQIAVSARLLDTVQQGITLVLFLALLLSTDIKLALLCLLGAPGPLIVIWVFGKGMRRTSHRSQEEMESVTSLLSEGVRGHRVVKAFGMERFEEGRFQHATSRYLKVNLRAQLLATLSSPVIETVMAMGLFCFLLYAALQIRQGELSPPLLIQFMANLMLMYDPIRRLNKVNLILQQALAAAHRLADLLGISLDIRDKPDAKRIDTVKQGFNFENVSFAYGDVPVLQEVNLEVRRGEIIALVGSSGAGKSTLVNLLPRFFDPDSGKVTIDGVDICDVTLQGLRAQIGIVTQETVLFDDTVRNNIAYGRSDATLETVRAAARDAFADEFISELPQGYDTVIGESGMMLSGGQRQRLAIARALFKNAPILILDEATSQLDSESEALVQRALNNLMQSRTTLVIAHRISTIMEAHRILVLEAGRVVEEGTHTELLARKGRYRRLFDLQFKHIDADS
jgi:subfamily B ATP-binding cassette protein MsbA